MSNANGMHIGHQIISMMDRLGVSPLPRNYNLCYLCISNSDQKLRVAMRNLGNSPTQAELDDLIERFVPEAMGSNYMRRQQDEMLKNLEGVISQLSLDQDEVAVFTGAVDKVSETLSAYDREGKVTHEMVKQVSGALVDAGRRKVAAGNKTLRNVSNSKDEMAKLREEIEELRRKVNIDELTRLYNRRYFDETLAGCFATHERSDFALIMLDIDFFKKINDTYGHQGGDKILRLVADTVKASMRQDTFVARTGGEEFAVILKKASPDDVANAAERIRASVEGMEFTTKAANARPLKVTVSVGACMAEHAETPVALYDLADKALYRSKHAGRNTVTISSGMDHLESERYYLYRKQDTTVRVAR
jgi:diguanylate cyclase|nr:GGDEF domain-containing protein [Neorhizobium tomejilense]